METTDKVVTKLVQAEAKGQKQWTFLQVQLVSTEYSLDPDDLDEWKLPQTSSGMALDFIFDTF